MAFPEVVSREQWLEARVRLLGEEKKDTHRRDALNTERRKLPMVRIENHYVFEGPRGPATFADLCGDSRQLIVQHIMFGPDWDAACPSCTNSVDELSDGLLAHLHARDTACDGEEIFHTYSTFGRGNEYTPSLYSLLDLTALGRQEAWEEPKGRAPVLHDT